MKQRIIPILVMLGTGALLAASGCASAPGQSTESGKEIAATGPTVMNVHLEPSTIELNRQLQPMRRAEITADVKDFSSRITDVNLRFIHVPITVPMTNIGGTTWRAELSPQQLQTLAVSGKTIAYDAVIEAKDEKGQVGTSAQPLSVAVKSPDISQNATS
jgi:hypothetical protein